MAPKVSLRRVACAVTATLMLTGSALVGAPLAGAEPGPDPCPYKVTTPPAVDDSEVPKAGPPPQPLPVPATALGGDALSGCGLITAPDFGAVTGVVESGGRLWMSTIEFPALAYYEL